MSSSSALIDPAAALTVEQLFDALSHEERVAVVTPNRRLAVYLKNQFGASRRLLGRTAWATPDILPFTTFLERSYHEMNLRTEDAPRPRLLDAAQNQLLWEQVVRTADVASHLLSLTKTAKQAASAWQLANAWELVPAMRRVPLSEDAEVFLGWAQRFQALCRERELIDAATLPSAMAAWMHDTGACATAWRDVLPLKLVAVGFDIVTPQHQHFFDACRAIGVSVMPGEAMAPVEGARCHRTVFSTEDEELRACAMWARRRLRADPRQRMAIVVPDLGAKRGAIARALTDALQPGQRAGLSRAPNGDALGFNLSLGLSLNDYALVNDALSLIEFSLRRPMSFLRVSALLRSPFIAGGTSELGPRARLDAALREIVAPEISLFSLQRRLKLVTDISLTRATLECQRLLLVIDRVAAIGEPTSGAASAGGGASRRPSPRDWSRHFGQVLVAWGFPGEDTLASRDHQVLEKFRGALGMLAMLDAVQPRMRGDEALGYLRTIVADTVFQPESDHDDEAPIQVLGILESARQSFDAIWVTGLSDDAWPLPARANPFIPIVLQRAAGVSEASAATSLALDQRFTAGWRASAKEVVFSHSLTNDSSRDGEQERAASPLTRDIPPSAFTELMGEGAVSTDYANALFALSNREDIPDAPMTALPLPTLVRGGAAVLRDQAACPFRAFARHRLGARKLGIPEGGLDAAERGIVLHRVLSLVWTRLVSHTRLVAADEIALRTLAGEAVNQAIAEVSSSGVEGLTGRFAQIEQARLVRLVIEWLAYERERRSFEVVACEQAREVTLSGLSMRLRLDRLDRLADGTHALIDYKTGAANIAAWLGERPDEPQLPLYFQTAEQTVSALAFARVKRGVRGKTFGFEGISAAPDLLPDVVPIEGRFGMEKKGYVSWDVLIAQWEDALAALATNFIKGEATVDPKNGNLTCAQCDLQSVCRVSELNSAALSDDDGQVVAPIDE